MTGLHRWVLSFFVPVSLVSVGMALLPTVAAGGETAVQPPNVVVILLDTVRSDALAPGEHKAITPFLDELRAGSIVFANARSTSSWTAPATASLFTSLYPNENGVIQGFMAHKRALALMEKQGHAAMKLNVLPTDIPILPQRMKAGGYRTFGVAANLNIGPEIGFSRGFDKFRRLNDAPAKAMIDTVAAWLPEITGDASPYFLYVHLNDAHSPYVGHKPWYQPVADDSLADARSRYLSEISFMDGQLARLADLLHLRDQDLLVIVSDHGEEFEEHGRTGHQATLFRELNDVVCLLHGPQLGVSPATRTELVSLVDILPTVLDLVHLPAAEHSSGLSLAPLCLGDDQDTVLNGLLESRTLFAHRTESDMQRRYLWASMRGSWKVIMGGRGRPSLYDLLKDPGELHPLTRAKDPVSADLTPALMEFRRRKSVGRSTSISVPLNSDLSKQLKSMGYVR